MKNLIYIVLFVFAGIAAATIYFFDGTGDSGDSITHYLFARYAPHHPELYFDHWAKPVFVLLASPFAQMGFVGMKIFNAIATLFTIFFTYKIAEKMKINNAIFVTLILICTPIYFVQTFSGLTEPLFAMFLSIGIYLLLCERFTAATILLSFLPFVRSEGLIILGVILLFLIVRKKWKSIPLLAVGHVVYSIAGFFVYHDLLWVFRKIPYAHLSSIYGHGTLTHFAEKLYYFLGLPIYILVCLGLISMIIRAIRNKSNFSEQFLFLGLFFVFLIAHTLFWYLGIFGSMGLIRVFICVMPVMGIIALQGINFFTEDILGFFKKQQNSIKVALILVVILFPFSPNPSAIHFEHDLSLHPDQKLALEVSKSVALAQEKSLRIVSNHPYLILALNIDPFTKGNQIELNKNALASVQQNDLIIWDNWFSVTEASIQKSDLDANPQLLNVQVFNTLEDGKEYSFSIYKKK